MWLLQGLLLSRILVRLPIRGYLKKHYISFLLNKIQFRLLIKAHNFILLLKHNRNFMPRALYNCPMFRFGLSLEVEKTEI